MNYTHLATELVKLYSSATVPHFGSVAERSGSEPCRIRRAENRSVSSLSEDLIAAYCAVNLDEISNIYISPNIKIGSRDAKNGRKKKDGTSRKVPITIKPDILLVRAGTVFSQIELKMDVGWRRNSLPNYFKNLVENLNIEKGLKSLNFRASRTRGEDKKEVTVAPRARVHCVLVSDQNWNDGDLKDAWKAAEEYRDSLVFHVLSSGSDGHPNRHDVAVESRIEALEKKFEKTIPKFLEELREDFL